MKKKMKIPMNKNILWCGANKTKVMGTNYRFEMNLADGFILAPRRTQVGKGLW